MPKTRPLTEQQAMDWENKDLSNQIMDKIKERKGLYDLSDFEIADRLRISTGCYSRIKKDGFLSSKFELVLRAVYFSGYQLKLEKRPDANRRKKAISATKDDTFGTIIDGLLRQMVQEILDESKK